MITSLHGTLLESGLFRAVIEAAGIGYEVHIPITTTEKLPPPGSTLTITLVLFQRPEHSRTQGCIYAEGLRTVHTGT